MAQIFSPREVISRYIDRNTTTESGLVSVRGIYLKMDDSFSSGKQRAFDRLKDELTDSQLKVLVPRELRDFIDNGSTVEMTGTISDFGFRESGILQVQMNVTSCIQAKDIFIPKAENDKHQLRRRKAAKGFKDVRRILYDKVMAGGRPRIVLVYPSSTVADTDFRRAVGEAYGFYEFETRNVPFSESARLVSVLKECDRSKWFDLVCLVRGGGSGLQNVDNVDVIEQIASMSVPVLTAVGHADDNLFVDSVADLSKETPSLLGSFLKEVVLDKLDKDRLVAGYDERLRRIRGVVIVLAAGLVLSVVLIFYFLAAK